LLAWDWPEKGPMEGRQNRMMARSRDAAREGQDLPP
jgi:hypothetical protein